MFVVDEGSCGDADHGVGTAMPVLIAPSPMFAALGLITRDVSKIEQCGQVVISAQDHISAFATVPARRTAVWAVFFAAKGDTAVAAVACGDFDDGFVNELHNDALCSWGWVSVWSP